MIQYGDFPILTGVRWNALGKPLEWSFMPGRRVIREYDLNGRTTSIRSIGTSGLDLRYEYDAAGQLVRTRDRDAEVQWKYDRLGRLVESSDIAGPVQKYAYDLTGNRTSFTDAAGVLSYEYPVASHRLVRAGDSAREYDASGRTSTAGDARFTYNADGQVEDAYVGGKLVASYGYNSWGERVLTRRGSTETITVYDENGHWIGDYAPDGRALRQIIWMGDHPVTIMDGTRLYAIETDHAGTPRSVYDRLLRKTVWSWPASGEAFGMDPPNEDPDGDGISFSLDMRFPGQRYDGSTGVTYNHLRDYDASTGRYLQSDPLGVMGGASTYSYAYGSPLAGSDPHGLLVKATYSISDNELTVEDLDHPGRMYSVDASSGGTFVRSGWFDGRPEQQIPVGQYQILSHRRDDWFRLDPVDEFLMDDVHQPSGRQAFRLHPGTNSVGCITVNSLSPEALFYGDVVAPMIRNTSSVQMTDYSSRSLIPGAFPIRYGGPVETPIDYLGTLEVKP